MTLEEKKQLRGFDIEDLKADPDKTWKKEVAVKIGESNDSEHTIWFCISDDLPDRYEDIVVQEGLDFSNFDKNPVIMYAHDRTDAAPFGLGHAIGRKQIRNGNATETWLNIKFATEPEIREAYSAPWVAYWMCKYGHIRGGSIGFSGKLIEPLQNGGIKFVQSELHEFSICLVGVNPRALAESMKEAGIDGRSAVTAKEMESFVRLLSDDDEFHLRGFSMREDEYEAIKAFGENPSDWLSNLESLKDLVDHLRGVVSEKRLGKGKRAELADIAESIDKKYKALAMACDDLVEKCHGRLKKMLDDMEEPCEEDEPKALFDKDPYEGLSFGDAFRAAVNDLLKKQ